MVAESGNTLGIQLSQIRHRNIVRPAWGLTINGTENYSKRLHKPIFLSILWSLICGRLCGLIFFRLPLHSAIVRSVHKTHVFRTVIPLIVIFRSIDCHTPGFQILWGFPDNLEIKNICGYIFVVFIFIPPFC